MSRTRTVAGLVAALILLLSSAMHSVMGWPGVRSQLEAVHASPELIAGMQVGWLFGGVCMLAFSLIAFSTFGARLRGREVPATAATVTGLAYVAFGAWALAANAFAPFYWIFVVPGALLLFAALGDRARR